MISHVDSIHTQKVPAWPYRFTKRRLQAHKTSLTPPLFIEVHVSSQESDAHVYVLGVSILPLSYDFEI
jgi:hypothetical protein